MSSMIWKSTIQNPKCRRALKNICKIFWIRQIIWRRVWSPDDVKIQLKNNEIKIQGKSVDYLLVIGIILTKAHVWNPKNFLVACNFRKSCWWFLQFWTRIWGRERLLGYLLTRVKWCLCPYKFESNGRPWILQFHVGAIPDESKCRKCKLLCDCNKD